MAVQTFRDSIAWQKAMELATSMYSGTRSLRMKQQRDKKNESSK
jgi:hypothetical protein